MGGGRLTEHVLGRLSGPHKCLLILLHTHTKPLTHKSSHALKGGPLQRFVIIQGVIQIKNYCLNHPFSLL